MTQQLIGLNLLKQNAVALAKQRDELRERDATIARLESHVRQMKEWFANMHQEVVEAPDGRLRLQTQRRD